MFLKILFILFLERGGGRDKERARNINVWLPLMWPPLGTWPATQACALTGNWTSNPLVHSACSIHWATPARANLITFDCKLYIDCMFLKNKNIEDNYNFSFLTLFLLLTLSQICSLSPFAHLHPSLTLPFSGHYHTVVCVHEVCIYVLWPKTIIIFLKYDNCCKIRKLNINKQTEYLNS